MKIFKFILLLTFIIIFKAMLNAQSLIEVISDPNMNYYEKINDIETNKTTLLDSADDWELKPSNHRLTF